MKGQLKYLLLVALTCGLFASAKGAEDPTPKPWPVQFHAEIYMTVVDGTQYIVDLWYDWMNGRIANIMQKQLGDKIWDTEWTNGTSFFFDLEHQTCRTAHASVGVLRPDWLVDNARYLGKRTLDGFTCHVWEKEDFITYYENVETQRPVGWLFYTGMFGHIITFEERAVLSDPYWQSPRYCFTGDAERPKFVDSRLILPSEGQNTSDSLLPWRRWLYGL